MNANCILCNPTQEALVLRSDRGVVILDDPVRVGHVLVGSPEHSESLHDSSPAAAAAMMGLAAEVAASIVQETGATKVYVAAIGDKDDHLHVHLVPRYETDANLGPFVFGASGWVGTFSDDPSAVTENELKTVLGG